jgi:hypothetical protein
MMSPRPVCRHDGCTRPVAKPGNQCRSCAHTGHTRPRGVRHRYPGKRWPTAPVSTPSALFKDTGHQCLEPGCGARVQKAGNRCRRCAAKHRKPRGKNPPKPQQRRWPRTSSWTERMRQLYGD